MKKTAILVLEDGNVFHGQAIGAMGKNVGEVVFNTSMTGYQEIISDPSYKKQIVTLTYPHIGNTGTNSEDDESSCAHVAGLVIKDLAMAASSFRNQKSLEDYLIKNKVLAIAGIDTRKLTRILRDKGALAGCIMCGDNISAENGREELKSFSGLSGLDLAKEVSTKTAYQWEKGSWLLNGKSKRIDREKPVYKVVAYDFGVKKNLLRMLVDKNCDVIVVPAKTSVSDVLAFHPDGIFLSNGPGDPEPCEYAISAVDELIQKGKPTFGVCLGHQIIGIASGAKTIKMKFGHHGANHPVQNLENREVLISSQNHCFAIDKNSLPNNLKITHVSLFDGSLQGIHRIDKPAFGFQGHPEASPGPHDASPIFDHFIKLMKAN